MAAIVLEDGGSEAKAIAALLHDAPEDRGGEETLERIRREFGGEVAEIVAACSDTFEDPKPAWRERKEKYIAHLATVSDEALRVSLADKLHNAQAIALDLDRVGDEVWSRFKPDRDEVLWYYRSLAEVFAERRPGAVANELGAVVERLEG